MASASTGQYYTVFVGDCARKVVAELNELGKLPVEAWFEEWSDTGCEVLSFNKSSACCGGAG